MNSFPRTVLLTWFSPGMKYGGAELIKKTLRRLPPEQIFWCGLRGTSSSATGGLPAYHAFPPSPLHWRLAGTAPAYFLRHGVAARRAARRIRERLRSFNAEVLWVLLELDAVNVAYHLGRTTGLPIHATVHDAHEFARFVGLPSLFYPFYIRAVRRTIRVLSSGDFISVALRDHCMRRGGRPGFRVTVTPPSVPGEWCVAHRSWEAGEESNELRIAVCGSLRTSREQWRRFLQVLGRLPLRTHLLTYAAGDLPLEGCPENVTVDAEAYCPEEELIRRLAGANVHFGYVGLWKEPSHQLFVRTSLSSKLATYTAAGLPVLVDGPADSVAWRWVKRYKAGILLDGDEAAFRERALEVARRSRLRALLSQGSCRLCESEFDLDENVAAFRRILCETARRQSA